MAFTHYRTKGIIIKKEDRGEADQLLTVFTENFGKIEILARGIRKITSKLRSGAELFYLSEIEFIQGKVYKTLTDALLIDKFKGIRDEPEKFNLACQTAEVLDIFLAREEKDSNIWQLLLAALRHLEEYGQEISYYFFIWSFLVLLGYAPQLWACPICQNKLEPEKLWFSNKEGGVVCQHCFEKLNQEEKQGAERIEVNTIKLIRIFLGHDWQVVPRLKIEKQVEQGLKEVSESYLNFIKSDFSKVEK